MYKFNLLSAVLFLLSTQLFAQENSPYSRYGIGLLQSSENISNRGMGGTSIADRSNVLINPSNPASYSALKLTSYQLGLTGSSFNIRSTTSSNRTGGFGLSYVNLAFPIAKRTAVSFGLLPYSRVKYNLRQETNLPGISDVVYDYFGGGSIQRVYVGAAHEYKGLSIGFNAGYIFGNYQNNVSEAFTDSLNILNSDILRRTIVGGLNFDFGASYHLKLKKERYLNLAATLTNQSNLNATSDRYWYSAIGDINSGLYSYKVDSLVDQKGTIVLPSKVGFGLQYGNGDFWKVGIDYRSSDWSKYSSFNQADSFASASSIRVGGEFTPDVNAKFNVWKTVAYRIGGYYTTEPLMLNGTQLNTTGVTVGLGYPIRRTLLSIGQVNASFEVGKRGTLDAGLVQENYSRFSIGVTLNDRWFLKRRYD